MNQDVDTYFTQGCGRCALGGTPECKVHKWQKELALLRQFILDCGLTEASKWGVPCYMYNKNNVFILSAFNEYCSIGFFKGALLADSQGILIQQTAHMQAVRQLRFTDVEGVLAQETIVKEYIFEAIEIEKAGLKVAVKKTSELSISEELHDKFTENPAFKAAFEALTSGRQKAYLLYFAAPKQATTRASRIEKWRAQIFDGKGLHD
jgi:uncharacterized protein YdeI (YjbR/CyaY-like superfamily)